jgi:hypothetical protein
MTYLKDMSFWIAVIVVTVVVGLVMRMVMK